MVKMKIFVDGKEHSITDNYKNLASLLVDIGYQIPDLCWHPALSFHIPEPSDYVLVCRKKYNNEGQKETLHACWVMVDGRKVPSCSVLPRDGMNIELLNNTVEDSFIKYFSNHPHTCITCEYREGCTRTQCSQNVPVSERCCSIFNECRLVELCDTFGLPPSTPRYKPSNLPKETHGILTINRELCTGCLCCVRICADTYDRPALGYVFNNGRPLIGWIEDGNDCHQCGLCIEVCPTGALMYSNNTKTVPSCIDGCAAGIDIPRYLYFSSIGMFKEALLVVRERVPFPGALGQICYNECERVCNRSILDGPVAIRKVKEFISQYDGKWVSDILLKKRKKVTNKRVAIIGAGPAGISAAYFLFLKGHDVVVFDKNERPGGMLYDAIPSFRLNQEFLQRDIDIIESLGINIHTKRLIRLEDVVDRFDAVCIAKGAREPFFPEWAVDKDKIQQGIDLLYSVKKDPELKLGIKKAAVVGGGNVAIDTARTLRRLGVKVDIVYRRAQKYMPAHQIEIDSAIADGVVIRDRFDIIDCEIRDDTIILRVAKTADGDVDPSGRPIPVRIEGTESELFYDMVFLAVGFKKPEFREQEGVFIAGDANSGPSSIIEAIADGREVAASIDRYLGGDGDLDISLVDLQVTGKYKKIADFMLLKRKYTPQISTELSLTERTEPPFIEDECVYESKRCMLCHLKLTLPDRYELKKDSIIVLTEENINLAPDEPGAVIIRNQDGRVQLIKGGPSIRELLKEFLGNDRYYSFEYVVDQMYSQKENELIQRYSYEMDSILGDELDDLF